LVYNVVFDQASGWETALSAGEDFAVLLGAVNQ
jgi:hypothetical protein